MSWASVAKSSHERVEKKKIDEKQKQMVKRIKEKEEVIEKYKKMQMEKEKHG